ncbi:hypothetical protein F383_18380 [Gossypium arboreum]|uniref:Uncharacterized protein n=1 Tax=Gossypium arboreum TaxID=29729 RepID=A0A0B0NMH5_GOSAR|nr:hypothetical protein F383_18380 [Gossypium arboreum]
MCHTRPRHTPVSIPMWAKIGYLQSHFTTLFSHTCTSIKFHQSITQ